MRTNCLGKRLENILSLTSNLVAIMKWASVEAKKTYEKVEDSTTTIQVMPISNVLFVVSVVRKYEKYHFIWTLLWFELFSDKLAEIICTAALITDKSLRNSASIFVWFYNRLWYGKLS